MSFAMTPLGSRSKMSSSACPSYSSAAGTYPPGIGTAFGTGICICGAIMPPAWLPDEDAPPPTDTCFGCCACWAGCFATGAAAAAAAAPLAAAAAAAADAAAFGAAAFCAFEPDLGAGDAGSLG
eukprot:2773086-Pyramimonas_sp.AAC.1